MRLLHQLDDENVPVEHNIFDSTPAHEIIEELGHKANTLVAKRIAEALPEKAFLRRQAPPNARRLATFAARMTRLGYDMDTSSSGTLQNSLFNVKDADLRKVCTKLASSFEMITNFVLGDGNVTCEGHAASQVLCAVQSPI